MTRMTRILLSLPRNAATAGIAILALVTGGLAALLPWWMLAGGLVGIVAVALIFRDPFVGVMLTLALAAQAVPGVLLPAIPVGGVRIQPAEILCLVTLASCLNVTLSRWREFPHGRNWDLLVATPACLAVLVVSIAIAGGEVM